MIKFNENYDGATISNHNGDTISLTHAEVSELVEEILFYEVKATLVEFFCDVPENVVESRAKSMVEKIHDGGFDNMIIDLLNDC